MYGTGLDGMFASALVLAGLIGAAIVGFLVWFIPWLWGLIQPWLHAVTA